MTGNRFEVYQASGKYRWRLWTAAEEIVAVGQAHDTRAGAVQECERVKRAAPAATIEHAAEVSP